MKNDSSKKTWYLEGSLMPQAMFLGEVFAYHSSRYKFAGKFVKNKIVLDAGSGSGFGSKKLLKAGAKKVYGIDISPDSIKYCQNKYQDKRLIFKRQSLANLDFPDNFFDLVVAFEVIEHIDKHEKALDEIFRVLKPGGILFISTPNKSIYSPDTEKPFYPFHKREFFLKDFLKILKKFKINKILGQYLIGKRYLYPKWHPKRWIRIIYANLPFWLKRQIVKLVLSFGFIATQLKIFRPKRINQKNICFSKDLDKARVFLAVCQKPK